MDAIALHVIWRETMTRLGVLHARVREKQDCLAASEFCRWLQFSGVIKLLEDHSQSEPLLVDGVKLRKLAQDVSYDAGQVLRASGAPTDASVWESVNRRLGVIEERLGVVDEGPAIHVVE